MESSQRFKWLSGIIAFLTVSALYLYALPQPSVFYAAVVLLHVLAGVVASLWLIPVFWKSFRGANVFARAGWILLAAGALIGLILIYTGTSRPEWNLLYAHILLCTIAVALAFAEWAGHKGWMEGRKGSELMRALMMVVVFFMIGAGAWFLRESRWQSSLRIENPAMPPASMNGEGDGPAGPFFPSSAQVYGGEKIPSQFFMESDSCKRCHQDVYDQWFSSAHHFSSFNNQWYRKSIEYMQDTVGTRPSKWCGGCHDPAVLYAGKMDTPIRQIVHTPEAQAGLGCMMCHSIAKVKSTMGQADFYLEYPKLHELAASKSPLVRNLHDFLIRLNPEPHRRVFLKPFMSRQNSEFCSSCHKVHLDEPVNHYRWIRGFNEYDNWQASAVSGQGARSFYYPQKPAQCADCHMPLARSSDQGNVNGFVHSHRFPAANTALPVANGDSTQLKATEEFLKGNVVSVDIFAMSPAAAGPAPSAISQSELSTTFAVGEEAEAKVTPQSAGEAAPITAPLDRAQASVRRGDTERIDVVVRTRGVGHFFPGGTVDAYDVWLELKATDDRGRVIFWSGQAAEDGKGPVEKGAHFYRSLMVDGHGNPINKRNAWATRAVVYVRLIPPGAADTVHYRMHIPENAGDQINLRASLRYRKFSWWNTQFAFAGVPDPAAAEAQVSADFDDRPFVFTAPLQGVSAGEEKIPDVPIVTVAESEAALKVIPRNAAEPAPSVALEANDWQRWNDYGIGLLLQGDLKGSRAAFEKVTQVAPENPDGWVNIGRAAVQEGDMERARAALEKALALSPDLARANFFYAKVLRSDGNYEGAAARLRRVLQQYPRDRVAGNDLGRLLFLQRKYSDAVRILQAVLAIDPEDLQAHYNLMLCYRGLGDETQAREHEQRYLRFKADESSQALTGNYRRLNPEDNNERQAVHEHVSIDLSAHARAGGMQATARSKPAGAASGTGK